MVTKNNSGSRKLLNKSTSCCMDSNRASDPSDGRISSHHQGSFERISILNHDIIVMFFRDLSFRLVEEMGSVRDICDHCDKPTTFWPIIDSRRDLLWEWMKRFIHSKGLMMKGTMVWIRMLIKWGKWQKSWTNWNIRDSVRWNYIGWSRDGLYLIYQKTSTI